MVGRKGEYLGLEGVCLFRGYGRVGSCWGWLFVLARGGGRGGDGWVEEEGGRKGKEVGRAGECKGGEG